MVEISEDAPIDFGLLFKRDKNTESHILGLLTKGDIYIVRQNFIGRIGTYVHEIGHQIGHEKSFKNHGVLTPDLVKKTRIPLRFSEQLIIYKGLLDRRVGDIKPFEINLSHRLISAFIGEEFKPPTSTIHNMTEGEINSTVDPKRLVNYVEFTPDGIKAIYTRRGRNNEIPACTVEIGALSILVQSLTLPLWEISKPKFYNSSHDRALGIVLYAYRRRGIIPPSYVDMYGEENEE